MLGFDSEQADLYSVGVALTEVVSGREAQKFLSSENFKSLTSLILGLLQPVPGKWSLGDYASVFQRGVDFFSALSKDKLSALRAFLTGEI